MTYLVMECHPGYAVVLDQTGRFLKVANLNYQVGETVSFVIECTAEEEPVTINSLRRRRILLSAASLAASFFLAVLGTWHICLTPYGAVRIQINPDLKLIVNRLDYVISADGLNDDGLQLLDGYRFRGRKLEQASDDLADRAMEMGYLKEGGQIFLTLESSHENWIKKTEEHLLTELESHLNAAVSVNTSPDSPADSEPGASVPAPSSGISQFQETTEEDASEDAVDDDVSEKALEDDSDEEPDDGHDDSDKEPDDGHDSDEEPDDNHDDSDEEPEDNHDSDEEPEDDHDSDNEPDDDHDDSDEEPDDGHDSDEEPDDGHDSDEEPEDDHDSDNEPEDED